MKNGIKSSPLTLLVEDVARFISLECGDGIDKPALAAVGKIREVVGKVGEVITCTYFEVIRYMAINTDQESRSFIVSVIYL